jgi:hypothetical protein
MIMKYENNKWNMKIINNLSHVLSNSHMFCLLLNWLDLNVYDELWRIYSTFVFKQHQYFIWRLVIFWSKLYLFTFWTINLVREDFFFKKIKLFFLTISDWNLVEVNKVLIVKVKWIKKYVVLIVLHKKWNLSFM